MIKHYNVPFRGQSVKSIVNRNVSYLPTFAL